MNTRGLPGTLAPRYHELQVVQQRCSGDLVDVLDPGVLGLDGRLDGSQVRCLDVDGRWQSRMQFGVLLDRGDSCCAKHRRAARDLLISEEVGEAGGLHRPR